MSDAELVEALRSLARASHPAVFPPSPYVLPGREPMPSLAVPEHGPEREEFDRLAAEHPVLKDIYANQDLGAFITANLGTGWRIQPRAVASAIVGSAARRVLFGGGDPEDPETLADEAPAELQDFLALLRGETVETVAVHAFSGVTVESGVRLGLPWGTARAAREFESRIRPFADASASLVVEAEVPLRYLVGEPSEDRLLDPAILARLGRAARLLPLAILLSGERENYLLSESLWQTVLLPGSPGSSYTGALPRGSPWFDRFISAEVLTDKDHEDLLRWATIVDANHHPSLEVAVRRTLSAVRERIDHEAALIDAVIAMESLFGHGGETEVTFRVTSAITVLLEADPTARAPFRTQLGKVYKTRSQVVHGGTLDATKLHEHKERAIELAVRCLKVLYRDFPQLISDRDRGMRLILRTES
jgi:hypothetical protein